MTICIFLGHSRVYDENLYQKLSSAIYTIVRRCSEVEFLFFQQGQFYDYCLAAVLEVKQHFPKKQISIAFAVPADKQADWIACLEQGESEIPPCIIDRVISPPQDKAGSQPYHENRKLTRWALQRATFVVQYLYTALFDTENQQAAYAQKLGLSVLDVTFPETAARIQDSIHGLSEREQFIFREMEAGRTKKEIGIQLGITGPSVQKALQRTCRKLRKAVEREVYGINQFTSCAIFSLGPVTYKSLAAFEQAVRFLIDKYKVSSFYVIAEYCSSGYINCLKKAAQAYKPHNIQIIAVTHYPKMLEETWEKLKERYMPPCSTVENIIVQAKRPGARVLQTVKKMMEWSDFCICNLSVSSFAGSIKNYMPKGQGVKLLDIGKNFSNVTATTSGE